MAADHFEIHALQTKSLLWLHRFGGGHGQWLVGLGLGGNESYPEVFAPFGGFADSTPVVDGRIKMPDIPGIGFEAKSALWAVLKDL